MIDPSRNRVTICSAGLSRTRLTMAVGFLVVNVLRQVSADGLEHVLAFTGMNDEIQALVYKARAAYLESTSRIA